MQIGADHGELGLQTLWVTDASAEEATSFAQQHWLPSPVLAEAADVREAHGIDLIWGSPVFLLDRDGVVVAEELGSVESFLAEETVARSEQGAAK